MIIWLASYPRSGNTFLRALLYQVYGVTTHEFYPLASEREVLVGAGGRALEAETAMKSIFGVAPKLSTDEMRQAPETYLVKTHEMPAEDWPAIYLVRDGRDALVSHAHFVQHYDLQLPHGEQRARYHDTLKMLIETGSFGGWSGNVGAWTRRSTRTAVARFEDLIDAPIERLRRTVAAVGYPLTEVMTPRIPSFEELHRQLPHFFRKGRVGAWREEMSEDLQELFWQRHGDVMRAMGYE